VLIEPGSIYKHPDISFYFLVTSTDQSGVRGYWYNASGVLMSDKCDSIRRFYFRHFEKIATTVRV